MCVCVCVFRGWVGGGVGADIWPSLISPGAAEVRGRQPRASSSMMFCAGMERGRGRGELNEKENSTFALCMCLYVSCAVQIYCNEQTAVTLLWEVHPMAFFLLLLEDGGNFLLITTADVWLIFLFLNYMYKSLKKLQKTSCLEHHLCL